jgi:hypothetical protein
MRYLYLFCLLFFVSCSFTKNTYMCGDHECTDKKEFNDYFAKNLIVEIKLKKTKKKSSINLIKLNNTAQRTDTKNVPEGNQYKKSIEKERKIELKARKAQLKAERKIKKIEEKERSKNEKKLSNVSNKKNNLNKIIKEKAKNNNISKTNKPVKLSKKKQEILRDKEIINDTGVLQNIRSENYANLCDDIKDCDIDKIAELLIKKGKQKEFPDITSN